MLRAFLYTLILFSMSACSIFGIRTAEEASYQTVKQDGAFEVRQYADYLSAETVVEVADWDEASSIGFKRLAGYIFGDNTKQQKISMTAPVIMSDPATKSQKLAMTAPVTSKRSAEGWKMTFVLPKNLSTTDAPTPNSKLVEVAKVEGKKYAIRKFSGFLNPEKLQRYGPDLKAWIEKNNLIAQSDLLLAGFDPPWTLPFLRRNEIMIEVK